MTAPLLHMALQRCRDDKGPVRKAGLILLEALLLVRHKADRTVLPDAASLTAIADAARDHLVCCYICVCLSPHLGVPASNPVVYTLLLCQVTVRRVALMTTCGLLRSLPDHGPVAQLLVDVLLPMVCTALFEHQKQHFIVLHTTTIRRKSKVPPDTVNCMPFWLKTDTRW